MALNAPALTETLIEAGINPSAARRVVDILERDHADLLTEAQLDRRLTEQDRLNQVRFDSIDTRFDGIDTRIEDIRDQLTTRLDSVDTRLDKIDERFDKVEERLTIVERGLAVLTQRVAALEQRVTDLDNNINRRFADLENSINQRFDDMNKRFLLIVSGMGISLAVILAMLGWIISRLP